MSEEISNAVKEILAAGLMLAEPKQATSQALPYVILPAGAKLQDLEHLLPQPLGVKGHRKASTIAGFLNYVNRFKEEGTAIFGCLANPSFQAVLDYHQPKEPSWCRHSMTFEPEQSPEWEVWKNHHKVKMDQLTFAEFIESNQVDIVSPEGATVLEIVRSITSNTKVEFSSAVRLDNGNVQLQYSETSEGAAGQKGHLHIPKGLGLGLRVFLGGQRYALQARFRYRITDRKLVLWYELIDPHLVVEAVLNDLVSLIKTETGIQPIV